MLTDSGFEKFGLVVWAVRMNKAVTRPAHFATKKHENI